MSFDAELLERFARKYFWWKQLEDALARPDRIVAQVMNIGDYEDVQSLVRAVGVPYLREVLAHAEAGQFNARPWTYWHYRQRSWTGACFAGAETCLMAGFSPRLDVLPEAQRLLWACLKPAADHAFALYGGTG